MNADNTERAFWAGRLLERIIRHFPERQIYFRANGVVRFVQLGTHVQLAIACALIALAGWGLFATGHFMSRDYVLEAKEQTIEEMAAEQARLAAEMSELQRDVVGRAEKLEQRQNYLNSLMAEDPTGAIDATAEQNTGDEETSAVDPGDEALLNESLADYAAAPETSSASFSFFPSAHAARPAPGFLEAMREKLDRIERKQLSLADGLVNHARHELASLDQIISPTGLATGDLISSWRGRTHGIGTGGPLLPDPVFGDDAEGFLSNIDIEGEFKTLDDSWSDLLKAYDVLDSLPLLDPADDFYVSSRFGRRIDPFKKSRAMHAGLDLAGWPGTSVNASAGGVVVKAGRWGAYGNMVEIDHGNGFRSRYGHLRRVKVRRGEIIAPGQVLGEMGCSGRCTSTHLHYEVWFGDKPRNPLPFMKVAENVFQIQQRRHDTKGTGLAGAQ